MLCTLAAITDAQGMASCKPSLTEDLKLALSGGILASTTLVNAETGGTLTLPVQQSIVS